MFIGIKTTELFGISVSLACRPAEHTLPVASCGMAPWAPRRATRSLVGGQSPSLSLALATADSSLQAPGNDERQGIWREESELRPSQPAVVVYQICPTIPNGSQ
jgi:hypothetical protein